MTDARHRFVRGLGFPGGCTAVCELLPRRGRHVHRPGHRGRCKTTEEQRPTCTGGTSLGPPCDRPERRASTNTQRPQRQAKTPATNKAKGVIASPGRNTAGRASMPKSARSRVNARVQRRPADLRGQQRPCWLLGHALVAPVRSACLDHRARAVAIALSDARYRRTRWWVSTP